MNYTRLLTIAGSDSGGGAGIQADLKTFSALGGYGMSVVTALTAQNTVGVTAIHEAPPTFVEQQIDAVLGDIGADAVKIGMLASAALIDAVAAGLKRHAVQTIVLDPVMVATSGDRLLREDAIDALRRKLLPMATIVTPNVPEAEVLLGRNIESNADIQRAAEALLQWGPGAVLVKAGHFQGKRSDDGLAWREGETIRFETIKGIRVDTQNTHGTGCTLSSAIAAWLGRGASVPEAVREAKRYLQAAVEIGAGYQLGQGHGPVHHFHAWWK